MAESVGSPLGMWLAVMVMVAVVVGEFWVMFAWFRRQVCTRILSRLEREVALEETSLDLRLPPAPPIP